MVTDGLETNHPGSRDLCLVAPLRIFVLVCGIDKKNIFFHQLDNVKIIVLCIQDVKSYVT